MCILYVCIHTYIYVYTYIHTQRVCASILQSSVAEFYTKSL